MVTKQLFIWMHLPTIYLIFLKFINIFESEDKNIFDEMEIDAIEPNKIRSPSLFGNELPANSSSSR